MNCLRTTGSQQRYYTPPGNIRSRNHSSIVRDVSQKNMRLNVDQNTGISASNYQDELELLSRLQAAWSQVGSKKAEVTEEMKQQWIKSAMSLAIASGPISPQQEAITADTSQKKPEKRVGLLSRLIFGLLTPKQLGAVLFVGSLVFLPMGARASAIWLTMLGAWLQIVLFFRVFMPAEVEAIGRAPYAYGQ